MKIVSDHENGDFLVKFFESQFAVIPTHWKALMSHTSVVLTSRPLEEVPSLRRTYGRQSQLLSAQLKAAGKLKKGEKVTMSQAQSRNANGHYTIYQFIDLAHTTMEKLCHIAAEILGIFSKIVFEKMTVEAQSIVERHLPNAESLEVPADIAAKQSFYLLFFYICTPEAAADATSPEQRALAQKVDAAIHRTIEAEQAFAA